MLEQRLAGHLLSKVGETVGIYVKIRLVYLEQVARKHHLGILPRPRDDGLDLVRRKILSLIDYEVDIGLNTLLMTLRLSIRGCTNGPILAFSSPGRKPIS